MPSDLMIELTFVDHNKQTFVPLKTFGFDDAKILRQYWESIPKGPEDSVFLADLHEAEGCTQNREVDFLWIEEITGERIEHLIMTGRSRNRAYEDRIRNKLRADHAVGA